MRPPTTTPRSGLTSLKSRPKATVMWRSPGSRLFVGSASIQPWPGHQTENHAWEASAPTSRALPGGGRVSSNDVYADDRGLVYLIDRMRGLSIVERV